jgi:septum formation protein
MIKIMPFPLILASSSPRRIQIMRAHGVEPAQILSPDCDEATITARWQDEGEAEIGELTMRLAAAKAHAVQAVLETDAKGLILACDTIVYDGVVLGKPKDAADAVAMLMRLSGKTHQVVSGVALLDLAHKTIRSFFDRAFVTFDHYDKTAATAYVATGEPMDKSGSYAVQGGWRDHVLKVDGDVETVVGLPWKRIAKELTGFGDIL